MKLYLRYLILTALFVAIVYGVDDIAIPLEDGRILIQDARFIRDNVTGHGSLVPELSFTIINETSSSWNTVKIQFDMGGICDGEPRQWSRSVVVALGWMQEKHFAKEYKETIIPLVGKVDGCRLDIIQATLVLAENPKVRIDGVTGERVNLEKQLQDIKAKRGAEAAARTEEERRDAAEQAEKDAARRKRLAAEQKKKDAELSARQAKIKAEEDAKVAEERARVRAACAVIYKNTANKKVSDLTVDEEQKVRACQVLGLYPPQ